jgi:replicative DNA helicase
MSMETEIRVLSTLIGVGDPKDIKILESMLQLTAELFKDESSRGLFEFIKTLFDKQEAFDLTRLLDIVPANLFDCLKQSSYYWSTSTLKDDVKFLMDVRKTAVIGCKLKTIAYNFEKQKLPSAACNAAIDGCLDIAQMAVMNDSHVFTAEMCAENYYAENKKNNKLIPSGIQTLDKLNDGGFKENSLITIAGRSGMGKTGFAVHLAHHLASNHPNNHVLFYSLEMSADDIYEKQLATIMGKQPANAFSGEIALAVNHSLRVPFTIDVKPMATISYIETTARITAIRKPISVIVVDYIGIVQNTNKLETHTLKQADISLRLAALAAELNCIVIALTQVNRDHAGRQDKVPVTSDAADSSGSERSSSYWLGVYRPEVDNEYEGKNQFVVKCRKNRFGKTWSAMFAFNNATFGEINQYGMNEPVKNEKGISSFVRNKPIPFD